jgi:hypothetical protein
MDRIQLLLRQHDQFIKRADRMLAAAAGGRELPADAEFHTEEIQSLESETEDLLVDLLGRLPSDREWRKPSSAAYQGQWATKNSGPMTWLEQYKSALIRSKNYLSLHVDDSTRSVHQGDVITVQNLQSLATRGSTVGDVSLTGAIGGDSLLVLQDASLVGQLSALRKALRKECQSSNSDDAALDADIGAVANAERAAREGDEEGTLKCLKSVGKWCLDIATKISASLAADAIKKATGFH